MFKKVEHQCCQSDSICVIHEDEKLAHTRHCKSKDLLVSSDTTVQMGTGRKNTMETSAKEDTSISP